MSEHLTEHVIDWRSDVVVERTSRTIRNAALTGAESKNGYRYSDAALKGAVPLYENAPVFLDHPACAQRPRDRSARDLAGSVINVRFESGRLRGDLRALETEAGSTLLALAEADGPGVGMSHVVLAERSRDGATVDRIVEVISVDAVAFPATTSTFRESIAESAPHDGASVTEEPEEAADPAQAGHLDRAEPPASLSAIESSGPAVCPSMSGSLERLLASIDAELPRHLRRLAAATRLPARSRGVRAGVFPSHIVVECRAVGVPSERFTLAWQVEAGEVRFGDELIPLENLAEQLQPWSQLTTNPQQERHGPIEQRLEQIEQRLQQITAGERAATLVGAARAPLSVARRNVTTKQIADDLFVRAVRRR